MAEVPSGWYTDAQGRMRYWDGAGWTEHVAEHAAPAPPAEWAQPIQYAAQPYFAAPPTGPKSFVTTWLLAGLLGFLALDRFYLGKIGTALLKLVTFAGFGIWWLIDLILVLAGGQRDKQGFPLAGYEANKKAAWVITGAVVALWLMYSVLAGIIGAARVADDPGTLPDSETGTAIVADMVA